MNGKFTDRARKVLKLANREAQRFKHPYIGTEHILLGLVREGSGVAAHVLKNLDIDLRKIRLEVEKTIQVGPDDVPSGTLPQTPRAKKVIEYAAEEAHNLGHNYWGTEHLLLGLLRQEEGVACQILLNLGLKLDDVREEVANLLGSSGAAPKDQGSTIDWSELYEDPYAKLRDLPVGVLQAVKELDAQIEQLTLDKEAAVAECDFENAAHLRDQADKLNKKRERIIHEARDKQ